MIDYLTIGHIAQDITPKGTLLGGTVSYSSLTALALGLRVGMVTAHADGAVLDGLHDVSVHRIRSASSTVFENVYTPSGRVQTLHARADTLTKESVPHEWRRASIVHLAPIAREIDPNMIELFSSSLIGITPQGFMREWDAKGHVSRGEWESAEFLLKAAAATVISIEDVAGDCGLAERWAAMATMFVVTQANEGATLFWQNERYHYPAPQVDVVEATGAGDIFAAAFFTRLWQTRDPHHAIRFAIALGSDSVTRVGVDSIPKSDFIDSLGSEG